MNYWLDKEKLENITLLEKGSPYCHEQIKYAFYKGDIIGTNDVLLYVKIKNKETNFSKTYSTTLTGAKAPEKLDSYLKDFSWIYTKKHFCYYYAVSKLIATECYKDKIDEYGNKILDKLNYLGNSNNNIYVGSSPANGFLFYAFKDNYVTKDELISIFGERRAGFIISQVKKDDETYESWLTRVSEKDEMIECVRSSALYDLEHNKYKDESKNDRTFYCKHTKEILINAFIVYIFGLEYKNIRESRDFYADMGIADWMRFGNFDRELWSYYKEAFQVLDEIF